MVHVPWHEEEIQASIEDESSTELEGYESVTLVSVGIDIGTTTTHLVFSELHARRKGGQYSSEFQVEEREVIYESPIILTPYEDRTTIDTAKLNNFLESSYAEAGHTETDVDTGAVIVTGEASRKENAQAITDLFAEQSGKFVCATAGANLEALMSAHGSGAVELSLDEDVDVLHVDIGGGTTKLAYIVDGIVEETASINVGARLLAFGDDGVVTDFEDAGKRISESIDIPVSSGTRLTDTERKRIAERFSSLLFELIEGDLSPLATDLMVTETPELDDFSFDVMTFAGGGSEYVYDRTDGYYDDLGPELGEAICQVIAERGIALEELETGIRATAIGSTNHSVQVSGSTILLSDEERLPLRNVPMVPFVVDHHDDPEELKEEVLDKLDLYDIDELDEPFAFGLHLHGQPSYHFYEMIGSALITGWREVDGTHPLIVAFDSDVARNAGKHIAGRIEQAVISIDGVTLDQFGYVDIGEPIEKTNAVPITVKSLLFEG